MLAWTLLDLLVLMLSTGQGRKREVMVKEELKENPVTFSKGDCDHVISLSPRDVFRFRAGVGCPSEGQRCQVPACATLK